MIEGEPPAAAMRLGHEDVAGIRVQAFGKKSAYVIDSSV